MLNTAPFELTAWYAALPVLGAAATFTWLLSLALRNLNVALPLWSLMLFAAGVVYALHADPRAPRLSLVLWPLAGWALWLAGHFIVHNAGQGEHARLQAMRARFAPRFALKSLFLVFWSEAALAWMVSLPLLGAFASIQPLGGLDYAGLVLWAIGFGSEVVGDWRPALRAVLPNYLGGAAAWWGFWLVACSAGAWWTVPGPFLMTWLLVRTRAAKAGRDMPTTS
jgi:steroid 5-alpha reductase family enzyme